ncbi:MAG: deoxyribodipyrimidine photo-lyase [Arenibacterium sp.]
MADKSPILLWFRRDLRVSDHPALRAASDAGRPVIPVFILDPETQALGAAPKWRLGEGIAHFAASLKSSGSQLVLRKGKALDVLQDLIRETGAGAVYWSRLYDPASVARDTDVKAALKAAQIDARSFGGHLMFEPWSVETKEGGFYKVYSPFWRAVEPRDVETPLSAPGRIPAPEAWPDSDALEDWGLARAMNRGAAVLHSHARIGESAAADRLDWFCENAITRYKARRDFPAEDATSNLSENLSLGEISPHRCWHAALRVTQTQGSGGAGHFMKELVWREFAYHLLHHTPHIAARNWREGWDSFPWNEDESKSEVLAWKQGRTGIRFVDAGMRELYVTGRMHNRARMIVASYLTKHLMCHWKIGMKWFEDCLIDWDPASNAMGWQWAAGSGPDAAPYFRIFNPDTQLEKFDKTGAYANRWIAEGLRNPDPDALSFFEAIPRSWKLTPDARYPNPIVGLQDGRQKALAAYENRNF